MTRAADRIASSLGHRDESESERPLEHGIQPLIPLPPMRTLVAGLPLLALVAACRSTPCCAPADDPAAHRAHDAYVEAINSNDVQRMLDVMTDDVVFLAPGAPVMVGKDVIRPWLQGYVAWAVTHWEKPVREFVVNGDWAFERYDWASTDTPRDGSPVVRDTGWGLLVYRRGADGVWRVARDAWGTDHPAPGAP